MMETKWISVDDRLPDHVNFVLVSNGKRIVMARLQNGHQWYFADHSSIGIIITHWMPLPNLPKQEDK